MREISETDGSFLFRSGTKHLGNNDQLTKIAGKQETYLEAFSGAANAQRGELLNIVSQHMLKITHLISRTHLKVADAAQEQKIKDVIKFQNDIEVYKKIEASLESLYKKLEDKAKQDLQISKLAAYQANLQSNELFYKRVAIGIFVLGIMIAASGLIAKIVIKKSNIITEVLLFAGNIILGVAAAMGNYLNNSVKQAEESSAKMEKGLISHNETKLDLSKEIQILKQFDEMTIKLESIEDKTDKKESNSRIKEVFRDFNDVLEKQRLSQSHHSNYHIKNDRDYFYTNLDIQNLLKNIIEQKNVYIEKIYSPFTDPKEHDELKNGISASTKKELPTVFIVKKPHSSSKESKSKSHNDEWTALIVFPSKYLKLDSTEKQLKANLNDDKTKLIYIDPAGISIDDSIRSMVPNKSKKHSFELVEAVNKDNSFINSNYKPSDNAICLVVSVCEVLKNGNVGKGDLDFEKVRNYFAKKLDHHSVRLDLDKSTSIATTPADTPKDTQKLKEKGRILHTARFPNKNPQSTADVPSK